MNQTSFTLINVSHFIMFSFWLLFGLYVNVFGVPCTTPSGQLGECVPIRSCSSLLWTFTNPKKGLEEYLQKFVCKRTGELGLVVCCRMSTDYLVFENDDEDTDYTETSDLKKLVNAEQCGVTNVAIQDGNIRNEQLPWLVKIMSGINVDDQGGIYESVGCTGVLINKWYVLHSAQCFHSLVRMFYPHFVKIQSYKTEDIGCDATSYSPQCAYSESYRITLHEAHSFYDPQTKLNDIAILRLHKPIPTSDFLRPICLPVSSASIKQGQVLQTIGWKRTYHLNDINAIKTQTSVLISNSDCHKSLNVSISSYEMCTRSEGDIVDHGSIGFPLMSLRENQWYLEGFESQGEVIKTYTRVQNYLQWINEKMGEEQCLTPYKEVGEGRELADCPVLVDAMANVSPYNTESMSKFLFKYLNEDELHSVKVCCGLASNFTIPPETTHKKLDLGHFGLCGFHVVRYPSNNGGLHDDFPWLAVIMNASLPRQRQDLCVGSLITNRYVLTTAQCTIRINPYDIIVVRFGVHNLSDAINCDLNNCSYAHEYGVEKIVIHPFYDSFSFINAISLIRLNRRILFTYDLRPICLPISEENFSNYGETLLTTGFGHLTESVVGPRTKKVIATTLISPKECRDKLQLLGSTLPITPYHICTEDFKNSTDVICQGDEGGPLMLSKNAKWFMIGVTGKYLCRKNETQVYLNVYKYLKWINFNMEN